MATVRKVQGMISAPATYVSTSGNGNPYFDVFLDGKTYRTEIDGQVGYDAQNHKPGEMVEFWLNSSGFVTHIKPHESNFKFVGPELVNSDGSKFLLAKAGEKSYQIMLSRNNHTSTVGAPIDGLKAARKEMREAHGNWEYLHG